MKTIRLLAKSNNKKNKTRSLLIMLSIFLSTILLTVICTYAYGIIKTQKANASVNYGSYYGICRSVTMEQLNEMTRRGEITTIGLTASAGMIHHEVDVTFMMTDEYAREMGNLSGSLQEGKFPEQELEIAAQQEFFESIGYEGVKVGDTVEFEYRKDLQQKYEKREFVVSGIINTRKSMIGRETYVVYASPAFYEAQFDAQERRYMVMFQLDDSVEITYDTSEEVLTDLVKKCGIQQKNILVNSGYLMWRLDPGYETMAVCGVIGCIVIVLSVIVIYNIFQVGIVQNIKEYGKIRAVGATKKQMRHLIYLEGLMLAAKSIPAGVASGFVIAWGSFEWLLRQGDELSVDMERVSVNIFSVPVLLASAALAFVTVMIALRRPMKIVSDISPVDAVRYQENTTRKNAGIRRGRTFVSVISLAAANISADRRRTISTILTMGLSCVLFVVMANYVGNIDTEYDARRNIEHGQFLLELDFSMNDKAYPENNLDVILKNNPLNKELMETIEAVIGVTGVQIRNILLVEMDGEKQTMMVLNEEDFDAHKRAGSEVGDLDYDESIYYGWSHFMEDNGYRLGQQLNMEVTNGLDVSIISGVLKGSFGGLDADWVITQKTYEQLNLADHASAGWMWVDCEPKDVNAVRIELENLLGGMEHVEMRTFADAKKVSDLSSLVMKLGCYLFLGIIGLIGFMNLANTMIINIITKKQEYGILQAVGMTNRQLNFCLQIQGLIFTVGTVLVALLVGLPAGYGLFVYSKNNSLFGINVYHLPVLEIVCMTAAVAILQLGLSYLLSKNLKKESLIDRIRYQE